MHRSRVRISGVAPAWLGARRHARAAPAQRFPRKNRPPIDLGSTPLTGAHLSVVAGLRKALGASPAITIGRREGERVLIDPGEHLELKLRATETGEGLDDNRHVSAPRVDVFLTNPDIPLAYLHH